MKKTISILLGLTHSVIVLAQGFVAEGANSIIARNSSLSLTPLSVGIGTPNPTAAFHTNGSLRFEGLQNLASNRILTTDVMGNIGWQDIIANGSGASWLIGGNNNITAGGGQDLNFLGSINNQAVHFRVNNQRRFSISRSFQPNGYTRNVAQIEAGVSTDNTNLSNFYVWSKDIVGLSIPVFISSSIIGDNGQNMAFSAQAGNNNTLGRLIRFNQGSTAANGGNDFYDVGIDGLQDLYFTGHQTPGSLTAPPFKFITISRNGVTGSVGIKIPWGQQPTADFHTVGTVRHENLPSSPGTPLVIDAAGNIYRSNTRSTSAIDSDIDNLQSLVADLQDQIASLQADLRQCCEFNKRQELLVPKPQNSDKIVLYQNIPNPFGATTLFNYFLPAGVTPRQLKIYNLEGKEVYSLNANSDQQKGQLTLNASVLPAGLYYAILFGSNGLTSDPVKIVHTR